jgi:hypothetical protein
MLDITSFFLFLLYLIVFKVEDLFLKGHFHGKSDENNPGHNGEPHQHIFKHSDCPFNSNEVLAVHIIRPNISSLAIQKAFRVRMPL